MDNGFGLWSVVLGNGFGLWVMVIVIGFGLWEMTEENGEMTAPQPLGFGDMSCECPRFQKPPRPDRVRRMNREKSHSFYKSSK